jgi:hypothetical protein
MSEGVLLADLPNVNKVPSLGEWTALLDSGVGSVGDPVEAAHPHPSERHIDGSHNSDVTSHNDSGGDMNKDTRLEGDAGEPLPRSSKPRASMGKSMGKSPRESIPLFGDDESSGDDYEEADDLDRIQKGSNLQEQDQGRHCLLKKDLLPPSTSGDANLQSPSSGHQYTRPKGPFYTSKNSLVTWKTRQRKPL